MRHSPEAYEILTRLDELGVAVGVDGDTIVYRPASAVPPALIDRMRKHKPELLVVLRESTCPPPSIFAREFSAMLSRIPDAKKRAELRARFEGRAGVLCWSRGLPHDEGDRLALESLRGEAEAASATDP